MLKVRVKVKMKVRLKENVKEDQKYVLDRIVRQCSGVVQWQVHWHCYLFNLPHTLRSLAVIQMQKILNTHVGIQTSCIHFFCANII